MTAEPAGSAATATGGDVFDRVRGQESAVAALRAASRRPVHAYLVVGAPGSGKRALTAAFAAALLCPEGGRGQVLPALSPADDPGWLEGGEAPAAHSCAVCARVLAGTHPDVVVVERKGPYVTVDQAREIRRLAMLTPNEAPRKVLVLTDFHLAQDAVPALLKVVEEPPASTVFVILTEHVPPELVTIASRCVVVHLAALTDERVREALVDEGVDPDIAERVAPASAGRLDRARLLAADPEFVARRDLWCSVPTRLDGTGATVAALATELVSVVGSAAVGPLEERHAAELAELERRVQQTGERGSGRKELLDRHKRELRRLRTDELRFGLATLAGIYRDAVVEGRIDGITCSRGIEAVQAAAEALIRNPSETLFLQALLLKLPALPRPA